MAEVITNDTEGVMTSGCPEERAQDGLSRAHVAALAMILVLGAVVRFYHFTAPPIDDHHWRQTQTLMAAQGFYEHELNLFHPRVLWRTLDGADSEGYIGGTELMVSPFLTALLYHVFGLRDWVGRVIPMLFALLAVFYFHRLARRFTNDTAATLAAALLSFCPMFIFLGRVQMPESFAFCAGFMALYYFDVWLERGGVRGFVIAAAACSLMLMAKPQNAWMAIPMLYLVFARFGLPALWTGRLYLFVIVAAAPAAAYVWWSFVHLTHETRIVYQPPGLAALGFRHIASLGFYKHLLVTTFLRVLGPGVVIAGAAGLFTAPRVPRRWFPHVFLLGALASIFMTPGLHLANDYYQTFFAAPAALLAAILLAPFFKQKTTAVVAAIVVAIILFDGVWIYLSYPPAHGANMYACGRWLRDNTSPEDRVLVARDDPSVLYYAGRVGWICREQADGKPMQFGLDLIRKTEALGAKAVVFPDAWGLDNYKMHRQFPAEVRNYLYDTYACRREADYAVFFLNRPADLSLPLDAPLDFGQYATYKYLRGDWGRIYPTREGRSFMHMGPEQASIAFTADAALSTVKLQISSDRAGRVVRATVDGTRVGEARFEKAWAIYDMDFEIPAQSAAQGGRHAITFEYADPKDNTGRLLFWSLVPQRKP